MNTSLMLKSALVAALTAAAAFIVRVNLPFTEVPLTLQVFFALLAGAVLGPMYGALSMIVYVLIGAIGIPVFAGGSAGPGVLIGPTGGYLIGFILAAYTVGLITTAGKPGIARLSAAMIAGILVIYLFGVLQLAFVTHMSVPKAAVAGAAPFILFDLVKAAVAALVARRIGLAVKA